MLTAQPSSSTYFELMSRPFSPSRMIISDPSSSIPNEAMLWLSRVSREPLSLNLLHMGFVFPTAQSNLFNRIKTFLTTSSPKRFLFEKRKKLYPGGGMTAKFRRICFDMKLYARVLCFKSSVLLADNQHSAFLTFLEAEARAASADSLPILLVFDSETHNNALTLALKNFPNLISKYSTVGCILYSDSGEHTHSIDPFLRDTDIVSAVDIFRKLPGISQTTIAALLLAQDTATQSKGPRCFERHIFIFCLTATRGKYQPAIQWVKDICLDISTSPLLKKLAIAAAFYTSLVTFRSSDKQHLSGIPWSHESFTQASQEVSFHRFSELFCCLSSNGGFALLGCQHPFLARRFLTESNQLKFDSYVLDSKILSEIWESAATTIQYMCPKSLTQPTPLKAVMEAVLISRREGKYFSSFVSQYLQLESFSSPIFSAEIGRLKSLEKALLDPAARELGFHRYIVLARAHRYQASKATTWSEREQCFKQAIYFAKRAVERSLTDKFIALYTLGVTSELAAFYGDMNQETKRHSDAQDAFDQLAELYNKNSTPSQIADLKEIRGWFDKKKAQKEEKNNQWTQNKVTSDSHLSSSSSSSSPNSIISQSMTSSQRDSGSSLQSLNAVDTSWLM